MDSVLDDRVVAETEEFVLRSVYLLGGSVPLKIGELANVDPHGLSGHAAGIVFLARTILTGYQGLLRLKDLGRGGR